MARYKALLIEKAEEVNKNNPEKQNIQRGNLAALFMSVTREIEMHRLYELGNTRIKPTEHFVFGNEVFMFDNSRMEIKGYKNAKSKAVPFTIFSNDRIALRDYLLTQLNEMDLDTIQLAKDRFDTNYDFLNEMYKEKYKVNLPKQPTYIPYATLSASYEREFKLKQANRYNVGVDNGMIMDTTIGARESLRIENLFSVIDNHTRAVGNYSFDRLITDFQNLLVNRSGGSSFEEELRGAETPFGTDNGIIENLERMFLNILQYRDTTESQAIKLMRQALYKSMQAVIGVNPGMTLKQFLSIMTISVKTNTSFAKNLRGTISSIRPRDKYYKWLMLHNDNFFFRAKTRFMPELSEFVHSATFGRGTQLMAKIMRTLDKVGNAATWFVGFSDSVVIVGAFKERIKYLKKVNPGLQEEEYYEKANEWLYYKVLKNAVANTIAAWRSDYSNTRKPLVELASKFQSENLIHVGSYLRNRYMIKNGIKGGWRRLARDMWAMILSGFFSALINQQRDKLMGYEKDLQGVDKYKDFLVNQFLWENMVSSIPYFNQITSMAQFDFENGHEGKIDLAFRVDLPGLGNIYKIIEDWSQVHDNNDNLYKKLYDMAEEITELFGLPVKNLRKIVQMTTNYIAEQGDSNARALDRILTNRTKSTAYYEAIKSGNKKEVNAYVEDVFDNNTVVNEIMRLLDKNPGEKIVIYDVDSFRKLNDEGKYDTYAIPTRVKDKFNGYIQTALKKLIRESDYKKMDDLNKLKTVQRVINYYYNYMKETIMDSKFKRENPMNDFDELMKGQLCMDGKR